MSWWEIALLAFAVVLPIGIVVVELYVHSAEIWWHAPKTDKRNWPPQQ